MFISELVQFQVSACIGPRAIFGSSAGVCTAFNGDLGMGFCFLLYFIQLAAIDGIHRRIADFTSTYIRNFLISGMDPSAVNGHICCSLGSSRILNRNRGQVLDVLSQFDDHVPTVVFNDTDIAICQQGMAIFIGCLGTAFDGQFFIQVLLDLLTVIADKGKAIIHRSHFVFLMVLVHIMETGCGIRFDISFDNFYILIRIQRGRTKMRSDITVCILSVLTLFAVFPFQADMAFVAVFSINGYGISAIGTFFAVIPSDTDMAVDAIRPISTIFATDSNGICQFQVIDSRPIFISELVQFQVSACIGPRAVFGSSAGVCAAFNGDLGMLASQILYFLQLGHVDSIGIERTCSHAGNLTGDLAIVTYGNGVIRGFPGRTSRIPLNIDRLFSLIS